MFPLRASETEHPQLAAAAAGVFQDLITNSNLKEQH